MTQGDIDGDEAERLFLDELIMNNKSVAGDADGDNDDDCDDQEEELDQMLLYNNNDDDEFEIFKIKKSSNSVLE